MFKEITKDNWLLFAQQNYDNPTLETQEEFNDDIKRFKYLKRLFRKYDITKEIKIRFCLLYTSPSPRDGLLSRMPSSA